MDAQFRLLSMRLAWMSEPSPIGVIERGGIVTHVHQQIIEQGKLDLMHVQADAHSGERLQDDRMDGPGDDGFDTLVVEWSGPAFA
jgi:hypothetical protein